MLTFFRRFFKSKIGLAITFAFLGLIAFAFASADVTNTGMFGGIAGGERIAVVGDERIDSSDLNRAASNAVDRARQQDPTLSMQSFVAQGGIDRVVDQLIAQYAITAFARENGLTAGQNLVNSEIRQIPVFRGADGNFSAETYRQWLGQQGLTDAILRDDLANQLLARQMLEPASFGTTLPRSIAVRYARLFKERREGTIGFIPSAVFAPEGEPSQEVLSAFYRDNRADFIRPERRVLRFAQFGNEAIEDRIEPTDAEISARYQADAAQYAASETRSFTQLIVPTQEAAASIRDRVAAGASLEAVAREAGFRPSNIAATEKDDLASESGAAVANSFFDANEGGLTEPVRGTLGWYVARVDDVTATTGSTLAQVRETIATTIREEKRLRALADLAAEIEEAIDDGETLNTVAQRRGLQIQTTPPLTGNGQIYGTQTRAPDMLAPAIATAFQMDESEPQVAEVARGQTYIVFEVSQITPSAAAPLGEIRDNVVARWRLAEGETKAQSAANRVLERLRKGASMAEALAAEKVDLPAVETVSMTREDIARMANQRVPPPLALLFSMAQGTSKKLETRNNLGWFVVDLDRIDLGEMANDDPLIAQAQAQLGPILGQELGDQLVAAMREDVGVERNDTAIDAVRRQLSGAQP